jgi:hypothetical protein
VYFRRKFLTSGIFILKSKVIFTKEELVAEDSPIRDCLPDRSFKQTMAAICLLSLENVLVRVA